MFQADRRVRHQGFRPSSRATTACSGIGLSEGRPGLGSSLPSLLLIEMTASRKSCSLSVCLVLPPEQPSDDDA